MWVKKIYQVNDQALIESFIRENGFATLVTRGDYYPEATHIPMEWELKDNRPYLRGHLAKANPHWKDFPLYPNVLAIFQSPVHHYISAAWYAEPNVSTWDYMSVHVQGSIRMISGEELKASVNRLTNHYADPAHQQPGFDQLDPQVQRQIDGVVGFEIKVDTVQAAFKMSQNRDPEDYQNIITELNKLDEPISKLMADALQSLISP